MKGVRRAIKLFCPMGLIVLWGKWRCPVAEIPEKVAIRGVLRCIWWIVPYGVLCVNAQMTADDRHPFKYWIAYGRMCRSVARRYGYVINRGMIYDVHDFANGYQRTRKNESEFSLLVRWVRHWSPYGLILWWDRVDAGLPMGAPIRTQNSMPGKRGNSSMNLQPLLRRIEQLDERVKELEDLVNAKSDALEIHLLKLRMAVKELSKL